MIFITFTVSLQKESARPVANRNRIKAQKVEAPKVELRNYFPETWLFDLVELDNEGKKEMSLQIPDTITTWVADAVCLR